MAMWLWLTLPSQVVQHLTRLAIIIPQPEPGVVARALRGEGLDATILPLYGAEYDGMVSLFGDWW